MQSPFLQLCRGSVFSCPGLTRFGTGVQEMHSLTVRLPYIRRSVQGEPVHCRPRKGSVAGSTWLDHAVVPTFRAENSNTSRHLAEFWLIEPELTYRYVFWIFLVTSLFRPGSTGFGGSGNEWTSAPLYIRYLQNEHLGRVESVMVPYVRILRSE
jgi:hypothetical protein